MRKIISISVGLLLLANSIVASSIDMEWTFKVFLNGKEIELYEFEMSKSGELTAVETSISIGAFDETTEAPVRDSEESS